MPSGPQTLVPTASVDVAVDVEVAAVDVVAVAVELRAKKVVRRRVMMKVETKILMKKKRILSD